ncbi:hypothetical protein NSA47_05870 [Irregularibacter muris]|uniref:Uncharacterized protein n=1 Tax=Irregularibacter muris TaxID=1796619 RepID=A0AAE3L3M7_9FIRM|nr:hypothetical protein [Irregularibacter muris]MCR1898518.1 hypothetical protein [Irregularibacter muris]
MKIPNEMTDSELLFHYISNKKQSEKLYLANKEIEEEMRSRYEKMILRHTINDRQEE